MAAVSIRCDEIIKKVINSNLDYKINQTPYSIYFSIRKKLSKTADQSRN